MSSTQEKSTMVSMLLPVAIALAFIGWGLLVFYTVGDKEPRDWDFGELPDVPGSSPYSVERKGRETEENEELTRRLRERIPPQHIDGRTDPVNPYLKGDPDGSQ
ncbi:MAG: hypothetical protein C4519_00625 [Desulfobacteraceae bacterium]|nr:MAG: hypothetical protein C4519_00625 [Desulfobacteraceae bacterium]